MAKKNRFLQHMDLEYHDCIFYVTEYKLKLFIETNSNLYNWMLKGIENEIKNITQRFQWLEPADGWPLRDEHVSQFPSTMCCFRVQFQTPCVTKEFHSSNIQKWQKHQSCDYFTTQRIRSQFLEPPEFSEPWTSSESALHYSPSLFDISRRGSSSVVFYRHIVDILCDAFKTTHHA